MNDQELDNFIDIIRKVSNNTNNVNKEVYREPLREMLKKQVEKNSTVKKFLLNNQTMSSITTGEDPITDDATADKANTSFQSSFPNPTLSVTNPTFNYNEEHNVVVMYLEDLSGFYVAEINSKVYDDVEDIIEYTLTARNSSLTPGEILADENSKILFFNESRVVELVHNFGDDFITYRPSIRDTNLGVLSLEAIEYLENSVKFNADDFILMNIPGFEYKMVIE